MIQKDKLHYELWLVGEICGQFSRVTRGLIAVREQLAKLATGTVESVLLRLGDSRPDERSAIVVAICTGGHVIASRMAYACALHGVGTSIPAKGRLSDCY
jgi:hypothetical protein